MATTSPDNLRTPNPGDPYNLVPDLQTLADDVQAALIARGNAFRGTAAERAAFTSTATPGMLWQDTDGIGMLWKKDGAVWAPAVWQWSGTATQRNSFAAPDGFVWNDTTDGFVYIRASGAWAPTVAEGVAFRNASTQNITSDTVWTDLAASGAFATPTLTGGITWSNGFVLPSTGRYEVALTLTSTGQGGVFGFKTSTGTIEYLTNLSNSGAPLVAGIGGPSMVLQFQGTSGQVVRPVALRGAETGTLTITPNQGMFSIKKVA